MMADVVYIEQVIYLLANMAFKPNFGLVWHIR